jgi:hypothetical protein
VASGERDGTGAARARDGVAPVMRTSRERALRCPACGAEQRVRIVVGASAGRAPEVRNDVLARRLHRAACACGLAIRIEAELAYLDVERRQLVLVGRADQLAAWPALEARLGAVVDRGLALGSPLLEPFVREVRSRVVLGAEALREKLVVWEAALDDGLVECIKIRAFAADPALAAPASRLIVDAVGADNALACWWLPREGASPARRVELPASWVRDAYRDRGSLEARFPELFRGGFVDVRRILSFAPPSGGGRSGY